MVSSAELGSDCCRRSSTQPRSSSVSRRRMPTPYPRRVRAAMARSTTKPVAASNVIGPARWSPSMTHGSLAIPKTRRCRHESAASGSDGSSLGSEAPRAPLPSSCAGNGTRGGLILSRHRVTRERGPAVPRPRASGAARLLEASVNGSSSPALVSRQHHASPRARRPSSMRYRSSRAEGSSTSVLWRTKT